jgi:hypothetical protein
MLTDPEPLRNLCNGTAPLGDLRDSIALELISEIARPHQALLASKLGKKASTTLGAIQRAKGRSAWRFGGHPLDVPKTQKARRAAGSSQFELVAGAGSNLHLLPEQVKMVAGTGIDHNLQSAPVKMVAGVRTHLYLLFQTAA